MLRTPSRFNSCLSAAILYVLLAGAAHAQGVHTVTVRLDKNGKPLPSEPLAGTLASIHEGDKLNVQYYPAMVFDLSAIDLPKSTSVAGSGVHVDTNRPFFVYPQDSYRLFSTPKSMLTSVAPGRANFHVMGSGRYLLHVTRLSLDALNKAIPNDSSTTWRAFVERRQSTCYLDNELSGLSVPADRPNEAAVTTKVFGTTPTPLRLYRIPDVQLDVDAKQPFAVIDLVQLLPGSTADHPPEECNPKLQAAAIAAHPKAAVGMVVASTIVQVAADIESPELRLGDGVKVDRFAMKKSANPYGEYAATTGGLSSGHQQFQICGAVPENAPIRRFTGPVPEWCLPTPAVDFDVTPQLPSAVRLQPGVAVVNYFRDVRLTAHAVFVLDKEAYFDPAPFYHHKIIGGIINPSVGLQLGGDNAIVLLLGGHVRLIDEAGLVVGMRFGDQSTTTKFQWQRNLFFGTSLDPQLFGALKSTK